MTRALGDALTMRYGGSVHSQDRNFFDESRRVSLLPDIGWKVEGNPAAVIERLVLTLGGTSAGPAKPEDKGGGR